MAAVSRGVNECTIAAPKPAARQVAGMTLKPVHNIRVGQAMAGANSRSERGRVALLGEIAHRDVARSVGGTGVHLLRLARELDDAGWRVDIVTATRERLSGYGERVPDTVGYAEIGDRSKPIQIIGLIDFVLRRRFDIVVANDSRAIDVALAAKRWSPRSFKLICALHNQANVRPADTASAERRRQARFDAIRARADALLAVSPGMLEAARSRLGRDYGSAHMIPNPAYREAVADAARAEAVPRWAPGDPHLLFVGRLSEQKDPRTLLRALAIVVKRFRRPARLTLLGEGPLHSALTELAESLGIAEHVRFMGFVGNPLAYMTDADLLVLSSVQDAFGYVLVEALGMGLPVVSTDCPYGPRYILDEGRYGRLVPVGDPEAMAAAIIETLDAPRNERMLIERAEAFEAKSVAAQYAQLFDQLRHANTNSAR